jgi:hypothetical protein
MSPDARAAALADLAARRDIEAVITRYCRALDRADLALMETVYWTDGVDIHGIFSGRADEFVPFIIREIRNFFVMGTHCVLNIAIEVDGDRASAESYLYSACRVRREMVPDILGERYAALCAGLGIDPGHEHFVMAGRYLDRFERRGGEWRIIQRQVVMDWNDNSPSQEIREQGMMAELRPLGEWGEGDPVYRL